MTKIALKRKVNVMPNAVTRLLPEARSLRPAPKPLGLFFRSGRNDQQDLLHLMASGESRFFGIVSDPTNARTQKELIQRAARRLDVILDPRTQASATAGGFNESLGALPWGRGRPHTQGDFTGANGRRLLERLAVFTVQHGYTQVLTPSHLLRSTADEWLDTDLRNANEFRSELDRAGARHVHLLYSLSITYGMLRDAAQRRVLVRALKDLPIDGLWLSVDGLGSDSTGAAVRTYVETVADFHALRIPIVADHIGGIAGLALLAFGSVGGLAHGVTFGERFDTASWRAPRSGAPYGLRRRIYIPALDLLLKPQEAEALFALGARAKAMFGCHDSACCRRGVPDMQAYPGQHFLRQRIDEVAYLGVTPEDLRPGRFVDKHLRSRTDVVHAATQLEWKDETLKERMNVQRRRLDRMRGVLGSLAEEGVAERSLAAVPPRRVERLGGPHPPRGS
jgi:hypothetical protein